MEALVRKIGFYSKRSRIYFGVFILSLHNYFIVYLNSTFLQERGGLSDTGLSILYVISSLGVLLSFVFIENILRVVSNYRLCLASIAATLIGVLGMSTTSNPILLSLFFIIYETAIVAIYLTFDIFLESVSEKESETGGIRALYLTIGNVIILFAPAISGYYLDKFDQYSYIYIGASMLLVPLGALVALGFRHFPKERSHTKDFLSLIKRFYTNKNLKNVYRSDLVLMFFYAAMVIYTPLYLHEHIGFSWTDITLKIFPIMLLPFSLLEIPLGKIADKWLGEKELLMSGFVIMSAATICVAFVESTNPFVWAAVLCATRIGASMVEIMTETYFFKHVDASDADFILFYRTASPVAYIVTPLLFGALLPFIGFNIMFITVGLVCFTGVIFAQELVDTK